MSIRGLTNRQMAFAQAVANNPKLTKSEAAKAAGYSTKRCQQAGCELAKHPIVIAEIDRLLKKSAAARTGAALTRESVIEELDAIAEMCARAGPGSWQANARIKVAEVKAKILKLLTDKVEVGPSDSLMALLLEGRKRAAGTITAVTATVIQALPEKSSEEAGEAVEAEPIAESEPGEVIQ